MGRVGLGRVSYNLQVTHIELWIYQLTVTSLDSYMSFYYTAVLQPSCTVVTCTPGMYNNNNVQEQQQQDE